MENLGARQLSCIDFIATQCIVRARAMEEHAVYARRADNNRVGTGLTPTDNHAVHQRVIMTA